MAELYLMLETATLPLPIYLTSVGINYVQKPINRPNGNKVHHLFYIEEGKGVFNIPQKSFTVSEHDVIFLKKDIPISYHALGDTFKLSFVTFKGDAADSLVEYFNAEDFSTYQNSALYQKFVSCFNHANKMSPKEILSKKIYDLVISYFTEYNLSLQPKALTVAKNFIVCNFQHNISVDDIAKAACVSPSLIYRLFKTEENTTPVEYLRSIRIQHACNLLLMKTEYRVDEIATMCGFWDTSYFCKVFKSETGVSPKAYRKMT